MAQFKRLANAIVAGEAITSYMVFATGEIDGEAVMDWSVKIDEEDIAAMNLMLDQAKRGLLAGADENWDYE